MSSSYRSPWLVIITAAVAALVLIGGVAFAVVQVAGGDDDASSSQARPREPGDPADPPPSSQAPPSGTPEAAAKVYGETFVNVKGGKAAWLRRLSPLVSPTMRQGYEYTELSSVPTATLESVGKPVKRPAPTPTVKVDLVYTDGLTIETTLSSRPEDGEWIVTAAVPKEPTTTPGEGV